MDTNLSEEIPLLTFNSLYNLLREEKRMKVPQNLPEQFYVAFDKFLEDKKTEIKKLKDKGDIDKEKKEKKILLNSQKIADDLFSIRCLKIANIAIENQIQGEEVLTCNLVIEKELEYMDSIKKSVKKLIR